MVERANPLLEIFERAISLRRAIKIRINDRTRIAHFAIKLHDCISRTLILLTFSLFQSSIFLEIVSFHKLNLPSCSFWSSMAKKRICQFNALLALYKRTTFLYRYDLCRDLRIVEGRKSERSALLRRRIGSRCFRWDNLSNFKPCLLVAFNSIG